LTNRINKYDDINMDPPLFLLGAVNELWDANWRKVGEDAENGRKM